MSQTREQTVKSIQSFKGVLWSFLAALMMLASTSAHAYSVFTLKKVNWSRVKTVDVFIAGYGEEMGLQFLYGAITRAKVHEETYPDSRAQVIIWAEEFNKRKDRQIVRDRGMHIMEVNTWHLRENSIVKIIKDLPPVSSLHIVSHNAAVEGVAVQSNSRMNADADLWQEIKSRLTSDAYVFLHGCNTGYLVAPGISRVLERPVFGSLTSTDFQQVFDNGQWYHNNSGWGQYPSGMGKKKVNDVLYSSNESCWRGFCHRMMPNEHTYRGYWGDYEVGLPYYKAFCNYNSSGSANCMKGIAHGVRTTPTIGARSWQDRVEDFLCPRMADPAVHESCVAALKNGGDRRDFFRGKTLDCSLKGCDFESYWTRKSGVKVINFTGKDKGTKPFEKEFKLLMEAGKYL